MPPRPHTRAPTPTPRPPVYILPKHTSRGDTATTTTVRMWTGPLCIVGLISTYYTLWFIDTVLFVLCSQYYRIILFLKKAFKVHLNQFFFISQHI